MAGKGVAAGKAYIVFGADMSELFGSLRELGRIISSQMQTLSNVMDRTGRQIASAGNELLGYGKAITGALKSWTDSGMSAADAIAKMARSVGVSATWLSQMQHAAALANVDISTLRNALAQMNVALYAASHGSRQMSDAFASIGLDARALAVMKPEEQFLAIAEALKNTADNATRISAMRHIFGRGAVSMGSLLAGGAAGIRGGMAEAQRLGVSISQQDANLAEQLLDMYTRIEAAIRGLATAIGRALGPRLIELSTYWANIISRFTQYLNENPKILQAIWSIGEGLTVAGAAMVGFGSALSALSYLVTPGGVIFAIGAGIVYWTGALDEHIARLRDTIAEYEIGGRKISDWLASVATVWSDGILPLAQELVNALSEAFRGLWEGFVAFARAAISSAIQSLADAMDALFTKIFDRASKMQWSNKSWIERNLGQQLEKVAGWGVGFAETLKTVAAEQSQISAAQRQSAKEKLLDVGALTSVKEAIENLKKVFGKEIAQPVAKAIGQAFGEQAETGAPLGGVVAYAAPVTPTAREAGSRITEALSFGSFLGAQVAQYAPLVDIQKQQLREQKITNRYLSEIADSDLVAVYGE